MANNTQKYGPGVPPPPPGTPPKNWAPSTAVIRDSSGQLLKSVTLDSNNTATFTLPPASGHQNISMAYTGSPTQAAGAQDTLSLGTGSSNINTVMTIVPGPGIYISPRNGTDVVEISLQPINNPVYDADFFYVGWTISDFENMPAWGDLSQFTIVGSNGSQVRSRDGYNYVDTSVKPAFSTLGSAEFNVTSLQANYLPWNQVISYMPIVIVNRSDHPVGMGSYWGALGYTNTSTGVWISDGIDQIGSSYLENGSNVILNETPVFLHTFYKSGHLSDALFLVTTKTGAIFKITNGLPSDFYDQVTQVGTANPPTVHREFDDGSTIFVQAASDLVDHTGTNYAILMSSLNGKIYGSDRDGNSTGTWELLYSTSTRLTAMVYGAGIWVAAGADDSIFTSTDAVTWTKSVSGWAGSNWSWGCWGNGQFVLVGSEGRVTSSTDGINWTRGNSNTNKDLNCIAYSPQLNLFVAVGNNRTIITLDGGPRVYASGVGTINGTSDGTNESVVQ